ncbi:MAG: amidoligase family protein [Clostridia bacterium]|nr:amidoligase family protein [Clostridia bacterium]
MSWIEKLDVNEIGKIVKYPDDKKILWIKSNYKNVEERVLKYVVNTIYSNKLKMDIINSLPFDEAFKISEMLNIEGISDDYIRTFIKKDYFENSKIYSIPDYMTVGVELEMVNSYTVHVNLQKRILYDYSIVEEDSLSTIGGYGIEVRSPILKNGDLNTIEEIAELFSRMGFKSNNTCGGHIHFGADYFNSIEMWKCFYEIIGNVEEIMYKICNDKEEIPRNKVDFYAKPVSKIMNYEIEDSKKVNYYMPDSVNIYNETDLDSFIKRIQYIYDEKYYGVNVKNINNKDKNTIEFRMANGTLEPRIIYENIHLYASIIRASRELGELYKKDYLTDVEKTKIQLKENLKVLEYEDEKADTLLDLIFENDEDREIFKERLESANENLRLKGYHCNPLKRCKFGTVDFNNETREEHRNKSWDDFYKENDLDR